MEIDSPGSIQPLGRLGASNSPIPGPNNFQSQTPIPGAHLPSDMLSIGQAGMSRGPIMSQGLGIQTVLPAGLTSGKFIIGYGDAHAEFEKCKRYYQNLAYSSLVQDEITIEGVLYYHASEKPIHRELEVPSIIYCLSCYLIICLLLAHLRNRQWGTCPYWSYRVEVVCLPDASAKVYPMV